MHRTPILNRPYVGALLMGFVGFGIAAVGAGIAYLLDLKSGVALGVCFGMVAGGVILGFRGMGKGWKLLLGNESAAPP